MAEIAFAGQTFATADRLALMAVMRYSQSMKGGGEQNVLDALYELLEVCIAPQDWQRFVAHSVKVAADQEQLDQVAADVIEALTARPTSRSSGSPDGPSTTSTSSLDASSSAVTAREQQGRPDLAQVHVLAERSRASA